MSVSETMLLDLLLAPMLRDAVGLIQRDVASGADVDLAMKLGAGHAEGPLERLRTVGQAEAERMLGRPLTSAARVDSSPRPPASEIELPEGPVGVIGTGFMASGIAYAFAVAGFEVVVVGRSEDATAGSKARIEADLARALKRERITEEDAAAALARVAFATDLVALASAPLVIEAVAEDLEVKRELFARADAVLDPAASLASNTSSLKIAAIASGCGNPERVLGIHFFSPVPAMKLVEVIAPAGVAEERAEQATAWAERIGKVPVRSADENGFIVNRLLIPMLNDAVRANDEGLASIAEIDELMTSRGGTPMGSFALLDLIGLDISLAAQRSIHGASEDPRLEPAKGLVERVEAGELGRKSGAGFHDYAKA